MECLVGWKLGDGEGGSGAVLLTRSVGLSGVGGWRKEGPGRGGPSGNKGGHRCSPALGQGSGGGEGSKSSGTQKPMKLRYKMQRPGGSPHLTWVWKEQVYRRKLVQQPTCFRGCDCKPNPIVWRQAVPRNKTASQETKKMLLVLL